jgi:hypothetical protein
LNLEDGTDRVFQNVGKDLRLSCEISQKSADAIFIVLKD